jgi:peroxiredoxin
LLSDVSEQVGVAYETRAPGTEKVNFAKRYSYLIDPRGVIAKSYEVGDVNAHAALVLNDLRSLVTEAKEQE